MRAPTPSGEAVRWDVGADPPTPSPMPFALPLLILPVALQAPEDPGPHAAGFQDVTFPASGGGTLEGRTYYPALTAGENRPPDTAQGPYPLVSFAHGLGLFPSDYDDVCGHLASWGFVVLSIETDYSLGLPYPTMVQNQASYAADMLAWMEAESLDPASFYFTLASNDPWSAVGHSMGGTSLSHLITLEPRIENVVALEPGTTALDTSALAAFPDNVHVVAGSEDTAVESYPFFANVTGASRALYSELQGAGHYGATDNVPTTEPMSAADQKRLHQRIVAGFLRAQVLGEEELYYDLAGEGMSVEPVLQQSASDFAPFWCAESALLTDTLVTGLAATAGDAAAFGVGGAPASIPTPWGTIGIDLTSGGLVYASFVVEPDGITELAFPIPGNLAGQTLYFQGIALGADHQLLTKVAVVTLP